MVTEDCLDVRVALGHRRLSDRRPGSRTKHDSDRIDIGCSVTPRTTGDIPGRCRGEGVKNSEQIDRVVLLSDCEQASVET